MKFTKIYVKKSPFGLFYLGKTVQLNHNDYSGSGIRWLNHLNSHGIKSKDIETWILHETNDKEDLKKMGLYYSKLFNVVDSDKRANLMNEQGSGGTVERSVESLKLLGEKLHNYITIYKDQKQKRVHKDNIDYFYSIGWKKGIGPNASKILSDIRKGKGLYDKNPRAKSILVKTIDNLIIGEYTTSKEASEKTGVSRGYISGVCRGKYKSAKGFIFEFKDKPEICSKS